jgi:hypothetical protein
MTAHEGQDVSPTPLLSKKNCKSTIEAASSLRRRYPLKISARNKTLMMMGEAASAEAIVPPTTLRSP